MDGFRRLQVTRSFTLVSFGASYRYVDLVKVVAAHRGWYYVVFST